MGDILYTAALDGTLTLTARGTWLHEGEPFTNAKLIELFNRSIHWDDNEQRYALIIGKGRASFTVEDTAYFVTRLDDQRVPWTVFLSDGSSEQLAPHTLCSGREHQLYCTVKGGHRARFSRAAAQILLEHAIDENAIEMGGCRFEIRSLTS